MLGFLSVMNGLDMVVVISMNIVKKDDFLIKLTRIYMRAQLSQHYILTLIGSLAGLTVPLLLFANALTCGVLRLDL
jgi:hypothetical protein